MKKIYEASGKEKREIIELSNRLKAFDKGIACKFTNRKLDGEVLK